VKAGGGVVAPLVPASGSSIVINSAAVHDEGMEEHPWPPPAQPGAPPAAPTSRGSAPSHFRLRDPLSIVLVAVIVIGFAAAGVLASELYARHRAESVVAAATECAVRDHASVSFGATPLLLQLATGHYRNIVIHTAGNRIGNARGMKADVWIDDVRLRGDANAMATVGAVDATITWSADGMKQSVQGAIPLLKGLVTKVQTHPDDGTIELRGNVGSVTAMPRVSGGGVVLQVADATGLGLLVPREMVQSALDALTTHLTEKYPLGVRADSVQVTDDGVTAHYWARGASIPKSSQGNQGNKGNQDDPCFANL